MVVYSKYRDLVFFSPNLKVNTSFKEVSTLPKYGVRIWVLGLT